MPDIGALSRDVAGALWRICEKREVPRSSVGVDEVVRSVLEKDPVYSRQEIESCLGNDRELRLILETGGFQKIMQDLLMPA